MRRSRSPFKDQMMREVTAEASQDTAEMAIVEKPAEVATLSLLVDESLDVNDSLLASLGYLPSVACTRNLHTIPPLDTYAQTWQNVLHLSEVSIWERLMVPASRAHA